MQQTVENSKKTTKIKRKSLIVVMILFAAVSAWFSKDLINKSFKNFNYASPSSPMQSTVDTKIHESASKDHSAGTYYSSNFKTESVTHNPGQGKNSIIEQQSLTQDQQTLNTKEDVCTRVNNENLVYIDNYRHYLSNINGLISNFLQDKVYSNQIAYARILNLPPSVNAILELLEEYNINYLVSRDQKYMEIFPKGQKILEKFIRVKKLNDTAKNKKLLRANIIINLELFQDYIYSEKVQKIFTGQRN